MKLNRPKYHQLCIKEFLARQAVPVSPYKNLDKNDGGKVYQKVLSNTVQVKGLEGHLLVINCQLHCFMANSIIWTVCPLQGPEWRNEAVIRPVTLFWCGINVTSSIMTSYFITQEVRRSPRFEFKIFNSISSGTFLRVDLLFSFCVCL